MEKKNSVGRPSYRAQIREFRLKNPDASQGECAEALNISKRSVQRHWKITSEENRKQNLDKTEIFAFTTETQLETEDDPYCGFIYANPKTHCPAMLFIRNPFDSNQRNNMLKKLNTLQSQGVVCTLVTISQVRYKGIKIILHRCRKPFSTV